MREITYRIAPKGMATSLAEPEIPLQYCTKLRNRFINSGGGAEKRQGLTRLGNPIPGGRRLECIHEYIAATGAGTLLTTGLGTMFRFDGVSTWTQVHSGFSVETHPHAVQMDDKLIFTNGVDRNFYTPDGGTTFKELLALIEDGVTTTGTTTTTAADSEMTNWVELSDVNVNDLFINTTTGGRGVITAITTAALTHTAIGSGATGIGTSNANQAVGDGYQIVDLVELNIIPTGPIKDNAGVLASGSSTDSIRVSAVNFAATEIRKGDIILNTTRNAATEVRDVSANVVCPTLTGQVVGDSVSFFKSAMPIAKFSHVHYGRHYMVDARDQRQIRISDIGDPQGMTPIGTSSVSTIEPITFGAGRLTSSGDVVVSLGSFQQYLIIATHENIFAYDGINPIGASASFTPTGQFPQGAVALHGMASIGNDLAFLTPDGLQSFAFNANSGSLVRANLSEQIKDTLRRELKITPALEINLTHYQRRSALLLKVGAKLYWYSYYSQFLGDTKDDTNLSSWSEMDGRFGQQLMYYQRRNDDLVCAGAGGQLYLFDQGTFDDDGDTIPTSYRTGHLTMEEPAKTVRLKAGKYIKPIIDAKQGITYTITARSPFDGESSDVATFTATAAAAVGQGAVGTAVIGSGTSISNRKVPLRWRGEVVQLDFRTDDTLGPDVLNRYTLYANMVGRR